MRYGCGRRLVRNGEVFVLCRDGRSSLCRLKVEEEPMWIDLVVVGVDETL